MKKPVEELPGAEPGLDQVSESEIPPRRSSGTGRKKKVLEVEDLTAPRRSSGTRRKKKVLEAEDLTGNQKEVHSGVFYMMFFSYENSYTAIDPWEQASRF